MVGNEKDRKKKVGGGGGGGGEIWTRFPTAIHHDISLIFTGYLFIISHGIRL